MDSFAVTLSGYALRAALIAALDVFAIACLLLVLFASRTRVQMNTPDKRLFSFLIISCIVMLVVDIITWSVNEVPGLESVNYYINCLYFFGSPAPALAWALYSHYKIKEDIELLKKRLPIFFIPFFLTTILVVYNMIYPYLLTRFPEIENICIFTIEAGNAYTRGGLNWVGFMFSYIYIVYSFVKVLVNRKNISRRNFIPMTLYIVPPAICCIIQLFVFGISLVFVAGALSVLMIYIHVQNNMASIDYLTNLGNRRDLEAFLHAELLRREKKTITGIMLDVDRFKSINDTFGHQTGDDALVNASAILQKSAKNGEYIARYAGDEFIIVTEAGGAEEANLLIANIRQHVEEFNKSSNKPYTLTFSIGYACFGEVENDTTEKFIKRMDDMMYAEKHIKIV